MPELPEVETTLRGIIPYVRGTVVTDVIIRQPSLRWPIPGDLATRIKGERVERIFRRAKYLLFAFPSGHMLTHLGMSGSMRLSAADEPCKPHDHVEFELDREWRLRFHDPRRFGCVLWVDGDPFKHVLLARLGPEPLSDDFSGEYLYENARRRTLAVKNFLMDSRVVVGIGNIYASEALYKSGIHPTRRANRISRKRYDLLASSIKQTLQSAISFGGTTLRDFVSGVGEPGYFTAELQVYEHEGHPCLRCGRPISRMVIGQRSTYYCENCQR